MLKNKLANFVAKRVLICSVILSIIILVWLGQKWFALAGLLLGSALSIIKFGSYTWLFERILSAAANNSIATGSKRKSSARLSMLGFLANQIIVFPVLFAAYFLNQWFFAGITAGVLLVPFVIIVNCITEALKITSNNFE